MEKDFSTANIVIPYEEELSFQSSSDSYCVSFVDIVDSTRITAKISNSKKVQIYYSIFLNTMATIARAHGAKVVKNVGDSLIYYFPQTSVASEWTGFRSVVECAMNMIAAHDTINLELNEEKLPSVDYRISADYGKVEIAKSFASNSQDLFGPVVNICSKINSKAPANSFVIGGDLYQILKKSFSFASQEYSFKEIGEYSLGLKNSYPVYLVTSKNVRHDKANFNAFCGIKPPSLVQSSNDGRIMLVEDDVDLATTCKAMLDSEGLKLDVFTNPLEAVKHFAQALPVDYNLIILDIRMPKMNGIQLFNKLKSLAPHIKIVFFSALDAAKELVSLLPEINYEHILQKPATREQFVSWTKRQLYST